VDSKTGEVLLEVDPNFYRPAEVDLLVGDNTKAKTLLGWQPKVSLEDLVASMVLADIERASD
jgi:GDPmannose 4,6-dehydratase